MSLLNPFERGKGGGSHSGIYLLARRLNGRKQPPSLSVMVIRTLEPTGRSFALGGHLETKICHGDANPALRKTVVTGSCFFKKWQ